VRITFTSPLDRSGRGTPSSYSVEVWNYKWTRQLRLAGVLDAARAPGRTRKKKAHDPLTVKAAKLSEDGRTVHLEIEGLKPVMQMQH
jgi:hypothetical protein